jgi:hypothetical protein
MEWIERASARQLARIAGGLYLVNIIGGAFAIGIVPAALIVTGDPAATAQHIQSNALLYRSSLVVHVIVVATNVPLTIIFYELFKYLSRRLALLVVFFAFVATAIEASGLASQFAPLLRSANPDLAYFEIALSPLTYDVSTVFFGFYGIALGYLVYRSTFLPRIIGIFLLIGQTSYLFYGLADMLAPGFAAHLFPWIQLPSLLGEGSLTLWLLIAGVNAERWAEIATRRQPVA